MAKKKSSQGTPAEESVRDLSGRGPTPRKGGKNKEAQRETPAGLTGRPKKKRRNRGGQVSVPGSANDSRRCTAKAHSTGERCRAPAIKGGVVCRVHGGAAPHVKKSAKERLLELADPAIAALSKIVRDEDTDDAVRLRAALGIMDRIGLGPGQRLEVGLGKFDEILASAAGLDLKSGRIDVDRSLDGSTTPVLGGGGGESFWEDAEQHAVDAQSEAWRDYDRADYEAAERGRIRPDGNTVKGEVVEPVQRRGDVPPDLGPTDPPRYWDEEARRADG